MVTSLPPSIVTSAFWTNRKVWNEVPFYQFKFTWPFHLQEHKTILLPKWKFFKGGLFTYFVVDTWNVLPVMSENDKSAGLWKVKVRSCFVMCLLMVTTYSNNEAGDQSEIIDRSDIWTRNFKMAWKTIYWFLFVYWRHNCSRCCKWLMEFYVNKLILDQILADLIQ